MSESEVPAPSNKQRRHSNAMNTSTSSSEEIDHISEGRTSERLRTLMDTMKEKQPQQGRNASTSTRDDSPSRRVRFWDPPPVQPASTSSLGTMSSSSQSPALSRPQSPHMAVNMTAAAMLGMSQQEAERHPLLRRPTNETERVSALQQRMKFYRALAKEDETLAKITTYPPHIAPPLLGVFSVLSDGQTIKKQSSLEIIFCIWNTMLGSTLLTMPWGFAHAGIIPGVAIAVFLCLVSMYTCKIVLQRGNKENTMDFSGLCLTHVGPWAQRLYQTASICVLVGALIAYHNYTTSSLDSLLSLKSGHIFTKPVYIAGVSTAILYFLLSIGKDPSFLVRLNVFGVLSVVFTMFFVIFEGSPLGDGRHFATSSKPFKIAWMPDTLSISSLAPLCGLCGMSFFIHNCILQIMENNSNKSHNTRDLYTAYFLVLLCYVAVGVVPLFTINADVLQTLQNFLTLFPTNHKLACVARVALVLQLTTVYPLILHLVRVEFFGAVLRRAKNYPGRLVVSGSNLAIIALTTTMAIKVPKVGDVLSWSGAVMGFVVVYLMPPLVEVGVHRKNPSINLENHDKPSNVWFYSKIVFVVTVGVGVIALKITQQIMS